MSKAEERAKLPEANSKRWLSLDDFDGEHWRYIPGYEDRYMISNYGRVKSLEITITNITNPNIKFYKQSYPSKILRQYKNHDGYLMVTLCKNGTRKHISAHRLVGLIFLNNKFNFPMINHKDECKTNNCVYLNDDGSVDYEKSNLEWCDNRYNCNYGTVKERVAKSKSKPVQQYDLDGTLIKEFSSVQIASIETGLSSGRISDCCNGKNKSLTGGGFFWKYKDSDKIIVPRPKLAQLTKEGEVVKIWEDVASASKALCHHSQTSIYNCIKGRSKTAGGYIWKKI